MTDREIWIKAFLAALSDQSGEIMTPEDKITKARELADDALKAIINHAPADCPSCGSKDF
jgi:methyl coenzyme M reductase gamma subunit